MELQKDAMIVTHDGREIGHLDRVAINPRTKEVSHLVVRKGMLFPVDKVIEMMHVGEVTPERITLRPELGDPEFLPLFQVKHYVSTNDPMAQDAGLGKAFAPRGYWTAPAGDLGGVPVRGIPDAALPLPKIPPTGTELEVAQNIPESTVALKEGAKVVSEDGTDVGNIVRIVADAATGKATQFLIATGKASKDHKLIPADWIGEVKEKEVQLLVPAHVLDEMSSHKD